MTLPSVFDFSAFPVLETERLVLRQSRLSDAADLLVFRGDPYVQRFNAPVIPTIEEAREHIEEDHREYADREGITWALTLRGEDQMLGGFAFHYWSQTHRRSEIGYDMARAHWGNGYATEALREILRFGFERMNLNHIYAGTIDDNHESVRLLERLGFHRDGLRRRWSWEDDGTFHDGAIYSLLREEFTHRRSDLT